MSLNSTASGERVHIAFFGMRNAGKSSLVNAVTGQEMSVVSDVKGTTTDPVKKSMELLPLGAVVIIDTAGLDDTGELGEKRVKKTRQILSQTDIAVIVVDANKGMQPPDDELANLILQKHIPYIIAYNKSDLCERKKTPKENEIYVSALKKTNINELKEKIASFYEAKKNERHIVKDLIKKGDTVILVTPIDASAPKGRLILPQQQTIREILDARAVAIVCQTDELADTLSRLREKPRLVITDSQVFSQVDAVVPADIPLTSFSILFARYKGELSQLVKGARTIKHLENGDKVLISEGCTHHRQCADIGTVKIPAWIKEFCGKNIDYDFTSGGEFPENLTQYRLIIHCGGCMLNEREMKSRIQSAREAGVEIVNYGIAIAHMRGILKRSIALFPEIEF